MTQSLATKSRRHIHQRPRVHQTLLGIGGNAIYGDDRILHPRMMRSARTLRPTKRKIRLRKGIPNECHRNSCALRLNNPKLRIYTGWALRYNTWYRHSWCLEHGQIVETTVKFEVYHGIMIPEQHTQVFIDFTLDNKTSKRSLQRLAQWFLASAITPPIRDVF